MGESTVVDDRADRLDRLAAAERRHRLFDYRVDGWAPWRVTRHHVQRTTARYGLARPAQNSGLRILWALAATARLLVILAFPPRVNLMVKTQRSALRTAVGDRYRDIYFDGLLAPGDHHFKMEVVDSPGFERQARAAMFRAHLNPVVFTFWGRILGKLFPASDAGFAAKASEVLQTEVGVDVTAPALRMLVSTAYWQSKMFGLLLRRLRPNVVLVCDTGEYGLVIACRKANVPVVELQHGVFDSRHPDAIPLWVDGDAAELVLPNVLATRNRFWITQLAGTHQVSIAAPVGNELIDAARARRTARQAELEPAGKVRRVVLTTQGMDSERLASWVEAMILAAPEAQDWRLVIKLHPTYDTHTTAFDALARHPRITVVEGGGQPNVVDLLCEADLHLSIASACLFEAAALGVPSLVIPLSGHEDVARALDGGLLRLAESPADVWAPLDFRPAALAGLHEEPGFLENMRAILNVVGSSGKDAAGQQTR